MTTEAPPDGPQLLHRSVDVTRGNASMAFEASVGQPQAVTVQMAV